MKTLSKIITVGSILGGIFLVACGSNNNNSVVCPAGEINQNNVCIASGVAGVGVGGTCGVAGQIQTSAGCGPECSYGSSMGGLVNNQCLPAIAGGAYGVGSPYGGYGGYPGYGGVGSPYGSTNPCISVPGTYPVLINGQMLCQPSYSGYTGGYYGGGYGYYYYR